MRSSWISRAATAIILASAAAAQGVVPAIGGVCNPPGDVSACNGSDLLQCDGNITPARWVQQNNCGGPCLESPVHKSLCFNNQQTTPGVPTPPTSTTSGSNPTQTGNPSPGASTTSSKSNTGAIVGGVVGGLAGLALLLGLLFFVRRRKTGANPSTGPTLGAPATRSSGKAQEEGLSMAGASSSTLNAANVASVLEKKYVVKHEYQPVAEDEIKLSVDDRIRLDLLFNDGWAKGVNESTGQQGLLPVACLQEL
ncbi:hypothetical protein HDU85_002431 [Gaertneriomyces sp. JEL0708]|nr:hypothetical protein HDU85_002431 [Gaertneriomyces sp. JEL0708]